MPATKQRIEQLMKMESTPLVYLEYTAVQKSEDFLSKIKTLFSASLQIETDTKYCMGYVSHPYPKTYRITTCRHLISSENGGLPSKKEILTGLKVFTRYEGVNKKLHSFMLEDVDIKIHEDELTDLLFIEISRPDSYNFQLLNQASVRCRRRFPGSEVYYFQNSGEDPFFRLFEGRISTEKLYITHITSDGYFLFQKEKPSIHFRTFDLIDTTKDEPITGASGSPILSRRGEVVGMICAHEQQAGRGIYLPIEKIERLYGEIAGYHA